MTIDTHVSVMGRLLRYVDVTGVDVTGVKGICFTLTYQFRNPIHLSLFILSDHLTGVK